MENVAIHRQGNHVRCIFANNEAVIGLEYNATVECGWDRPDDIPRKKVIFKYEDLSY